MWASNVDTGKAWEYGLARQLADILNRSASLHINAPRTRSQDAYDAMSPFERRRMDRAANEAVVFLRAHDDRLVSASAIEMQSDMKGAEGDVRDILVETHSGTVGISAKHRHSAVKHSRLSDTIDFGRDWYGVPCSTEYWRRAKPIFGELRNRFGLWRDMGDEKKEIYLSVLDAFMYETRKNAIPEKMMRYLLGKYDFYKIIKENGDVSLTSFNMDGSLKWGKRIAMPNTIIDISMKPNSPTTVIMNFDHGWQLSFRIHNANSMIEPSLKFDVQLIGLPMNLSRHQIPYG